MRRAVARLAAPEGYRAAERREPRAARTPPGLGLSTTDTLKKAGCPRAESPAQGTRIPNGYPRSKHDGFGSNALDSVRAVVRLWTAAQRSLGRGPWFIYASYLTADLHPPGGSAERLSPRQRGIAGSGWLRWIRPRDIDHRDIDRGKPPVSRRRIIKATADGRQRA